MSISSTSHMLVITIAQAAPTELFLPDSATPQSTNPTLLLTLAAATILIIGAVWFRAMTQRRTDPRELAFRTLSRKLKLSHAQITSLRTMSAAQGLPSPIGLLLSPSAIRSVQPPPTNPML